MSGVPLHGPWPVIQKKLMPGVPLRPGVTQVAEHSFGLPSAETAPEAGGTSSCSGLLEGKRLPEKHNWFARVVLEHFWLDLRLGVELSVARVTWSFQLADLATAVTLTLVMLSLGKFAASVLLRTQCKNQGMTLLVV